MIEYKSGVVVVVGGSGGRCFLQFCNWEGSVSDIIEASKYFQGCQIYDNERQAGKEMSPMSPLSSTSPLSPMSPRSEEDIKDNVGDMKQQ